MEKFHIQPIGHIRTPYNTLEDCPRNIDINGPICTLVLDDNLHDGLLGLYEGQDILVLYWFDAVDRTVLQQHSRRSGKLAGIFALRTPNRCNPIGAAVVKIITIENGSLNVRGLDCLDHTPLIDIKPAMKHE